MNTTTSNNSQLFDIRAVIMIAISFMFYLWIYWLYNGEGDRLTPTQTSILPINPIRNITTLLFFLLVVLNLVVMLLKTRRSARNI